MKVNKLNSLNSVNGAKTTNLKKQLATIATTLFYMFSNPLSAKAEISNYNLNELRFASETKDTYPAFLNVYGLGQKVENTSYDGIGVNFHTNNIEGTAEFGPDFKKASIIGIKKIGKFYGKVGGGYLNLENYTVGEYTINPTQITGGLAIGYNKGNNFNIEAGYIAHKLIGAENADTTAYTKYLELIYRANTNIGQIDLTGIAKQQEAYSQTNNYLSGSIAYYPIKDIKTQVSYNSLGTYNKNNYNIQAGIKYSFGGKKGKLSPFISGTYYNNSNISTTVAYENNIANRPLYWKDEFEAAINIKQIVAEKVAPQEFKKKVEESFNKAPSISISTSSSTITLGQSITLSANASDPDGTISSIVWYDSNGNKIGTGNTITITPDSSGTFSYYAIATDNDGTTTKSNSISIEVQEAYNASWQTPLQSEVNNIGLAPGEISDASGEQVVINDLTAYTTNLPEGSTFQIISAVTNSGDPTRMSGFSIVGNSLIRNGPNTGGEITQGTLTIQIIYPDGSAGPTATLDVIIANT